VARRTPALDAAQALWFSSGRRSRKARNLVADPRCVVTAEDASEPVVVEGHARIEHERDAIAHVADLMNAKYSGTSFVNVAGLRLRVARHGARRPLLFITGIGANLEMWAPFARLVSDRELIAFDAPGTGLSPRPRRPLRMRNLARVVRELMDVLALERADVLGYSFGGGLAQEFARRSRDRIRRLVLCATGPGLGGVPPRPIAALMLATPARCFHPRLLALSVPRIAGGRTARDPRVLYEHAGARLARPPDPLCYASSSMRPPAGRACCAPRHDTDAGRGRRR
jgi:pimeloyl-ACP methyl ester carboxylesterase